MRQGLFVVAGAERQFATNREDRGIVLRALVEDFGEFVRVSAAKRGGLAQRGRKIEQMAEGSFKIAGGFSFLGKMVGMTGRLFLRNETR